MDRENNSKIQNRLNRIAGQIAGLQKMVDEDRYCVDVLTQVAAVRSALDSLGVELLTRHIAHCVVDHTGNSAHPETRSRSTDELVEELKTSLSRFIR
ncbi:MAG TPA: metal-sensitive transcriptional regulator [Tepidisphaeraceae bacterium]|nr:metal-sensitive transcriptional regulator [Tepidisphaeraceae bacterium]